MWCSMPSPICSSSMFPPSVPDSFQAHSKHSHARPREVHPQICCSFPFCSGSCLGSWGLSPSKALCRQHRKGPGRAELTMETIAHSSSGQPGWAKCPRGDQEDAKMKKTVSVHFPESGVSLCEICVGLLACRCHVHFVSPALGSSKRDVWSNYFEKSCLSDALLGIP